MKWLLPLALALLLTACGGAAAPAPARPPTPATHQVVYKVLGPQYTKARVTMRNAQGNTEQHEVSLPWETRLTVTGRQFLYLSAQTQSGRAETQITCGISVGGRTVAQATSDGSFAIVSCDGSSE